MKPEATTKPTVTFLGAGYLGLTYAAVFAAAGIKTYAVEPNPRRLELIKQGRSFFYEDGLNELVAAGVKSGNLIPTSSYTESVGASDVIFSSVGTPDNPDGSPNLDYIFAAANEAIKHMRPDAVFVQKSTVPVGTGRKIKKLFREAGSKATYVSSPEFLAESTSVLDTLYYDRLVISNEDPRGTQAVLDLHEEVDKHRDRIAKTAGIKPIKRAGQRVIVSLESAELIKAAANSFLALKISFANSIAKLADAAGADIVEVMDGLGVDHRIGRNFLNAGRGYGGGCFPKDVSGLIYSATDHGVDLAIMTAAQNLNDSMPGYIVSKAQSVLGDLRGKKVAVLGLAFKAGTSDVRRSPGVALANILSKAGAKVSAYDPRANREAKADLRSDVVMAKSTEEALHGSDAVFVATDWKEFTQYSLKDLAKSMHGAVLVDCMNAFSKQAAHSAGLTYIGVGR